MKSATKGSGKRRKKAGSKKRKHPKNYTSAPFVFTNYIEDFERQNLPIYGCSFNRFVQNKDIFATVGSNRVSIYEATPLGYQEEVSLSGKNSHGSKAIRKVPLKLLRCYSDPDPDEIFYTVCWSKDQESKAFLLAVGGLRGIIRIINVSSMNREISLIGHGKNNCFPLFNFIIINYQFIFEVTPSMN